jgi:hypothetical protein
MRHQKRIIEVVARARRRVKALEEQAAPWPWRARARRQLRRVEAKTRTVKE